MLNKFSLGQIERRISNVGVHFVDVPPSDLSFHQHRVLGKGLTFIPSTHPWTKHNVQSICSGFSELERTLATRHLFATSPDSTGSRERNLKFRVPNPDWYPPVPLPSCVLQYLQDSRRRVQATLRTVAPLFTQSPCAARLANISHQELQAAHELKQHPHLIIKPADKGLGTCVVSTNWYTRNVQLHLNDTAVYKRIPSIPTTQIANALLAMLREPFAKCLTHYELRFISDTARTHRNALFYLIIKVHKTPVVGRPIVSSCRWITANASIWLDAQLQPLLKALPSVLRDSTALIKTLQHTRVDPSDLLITMDVVALYPSIPLDTAIPAVCLYIRLHILDPRRAKLMCILLEFVLRNNFFAYGDTYWHQLRGTAMGTSVACCFANLYIYTLEQRMRAEHPTLCTPTRMLKRFIDDSFMIWHGTAAQFLLYLHAFNNLCPSINCTYYMSSTAVDFLDITIFKASAEHIGSLYTRLFEKTLNKYLPPLHFSAHPKHALTAFISGELIRYTRVCSLESDFIAARHRFRYRLQARGYPNAFINTAYAKVQYTDRHKYLYINTPKQVNVGLLPFKLQYTPVMHLLKIGSCLKTTHDISLLHHPLYRHLFTTQPTITYSMPPSLGSKLISTAQVKP